MSTDYSQDASFERLMSNLAEEETFQNVTRSSVLAAIMRAVAKEGAYRYIGALSAVHEATWETATNVESLSAKSKVLAYNPHRQIGSSGVLQISTGENFDQFNLYPYSIDIPFGSLFEVGGYLFTNLKAYEIPANYEAGDNRFEIDVVQGTPQTINYSPTVTEDYAQISIAGDDVEDINILVWVNGNEWTKVDSLRESTEESAHIFSVTTLKEQAGVTINFGNDVFGKRIEAGDTIKIIYLSTDGEAGNIPSANTESKVISVLYDSENNVVPAICTNPKALSGGKDYESIESIRRNAPIYQQNKKALVSIPQYEEYLNSEEFPYLDKVAVWGASEVNEDNNNAPGTYIANEANNIYIAGVSYLGEDAIDYEITIRETLDLLKSPTALIQITKVNVIRVVFHITAFVTSANYTLKKVKDNIEEVLSDGYSLVKMAYKQNINQSQYVSLINTAEGLHHHITTLSYYQQEDFEGLVTPIEIYMENITKDSLEIYVKHSSEDLWTQISTVADDTTYVQSIIGLGDYVGLVSGSIDIRYGLGSFTIEEGALPNPIEEYEYRVAFKTDTVDALLTKRNQLLVFGEAITDASYEGMY